MEGRVVGNQPQGPLFRYVTRDTLRDKRRKNSKSFDFLTKRRPEKF